MKKIAIIFLSIFLVSCTIAPSFDTSEYLFLSELKIDATRMKNNCPNLSVADINSTLKYKTEVLVSYSQYLPSNSQIYQVSQILDKLVSELATSYQSTTKPSPAYCSLKLANIVDGVDRIQKAMAILER